MSRPFDLDGKAALVSSKVRVTMAVACLLAPGASAAQAAPAELDAYARVVAVLNGTTAYVGESLLACAAANVLTEGEAEERFKSYRERNAASAARAEAWSREVEGRLRARGEERAARQRAEEAGLSAIASSSQQADREIGAAPDARTICTDRLAAIEAGAFDLSRNPEFLGLLGR
jgi:hypothetical protein